MRAALIVALVLVGCAGRCDCQKITMACGGANFTAWNAAADRLLTNRTDVQLREDNGTRNLAFLYATGFGWTDTAGIAGQQEAAAQLARDRFPADLAAFENTSGLAHIGALTFGGCAEAFV